MKEMKRITGFVIVLLVIIIGSSFVLEPQASWVYDLRVNIFFFASSLFILFLGALNFAFDTPIQRKYTLLVGLLFGMIMIVYALLTLNHFANILADFIRIFIAFSSMILTFYFLMQDADYDPYNDSSDSFDTHDPHSFT